VPYDTPSYNASVKRSRLDLTKKRKKPRDNSTNDKAKSRSFSCADTGCCTSRRMFTLGGNQQRMSHFVATLWPSYVIYEYYSTISDVHKIQLYTQKKNILGTNDGKLSDDSLLVFGATKKQRNVLANTIRVRS